MRRFGRLRRWLLGFAGLSVLMLTACGHDQGSIRQINECIARGGVPSFTADKYGDVVDFLGCSVAP